MKEAATFEKFDQALLLFKSDAERAASRKKRIWRRQRWKHS